MTDPDRERLRWVERQFEEPEEVDEPDPDAVYEWWAGK